MIHYSLFFRKSVCLAFALGAGAAWLSICACAIAEEEEASSAPFLRTPTTFVYVLSPWHVALEQSFTATQERDPRKWGSRLGEEVELGLPGGLQLGVNLDISGDDHRHFRRAGESLEARWALAELFHRGTPGAPQRGWGSGLWGNPVLFGEWQFHQEGADAGEARLLLSEDFAHHRWFWAANLFYDRV